ncbi:MAG TPA: uridine kinase [Chitinophagales bacterium]|nr:uridine kinase [Chitinophagales bacterium]
MLVIGITGGSGSGKTTVVTEILKHFPGKVVSVVHMDSYYKDNGHLSHEERLLINFDHPDAIEFSLLEKDLFNLKSGKAIEEPTYDFVHSARRKETIHVAPAHVILVEGILLFTDERIRNLCDMKVFVDAEPDDRLIRIIHRDIKERGRTIDEVLERYPLIKEMHMQFIEPTKRHCDIIIPKGAENKVAINMMVSTIKVKLQQEGVKVPAS